ncbi:unnamed protein product [Blepharisma stoltei]|uniref:Uncharacterized protein n=1 Tax=Blepharisma stoltei TaxID=1481888 RepID=A0AAU9ITD1_9CILI|nr:unnamed protein product [Blepharisma stoltei]
MKSNSFLEVRTITWSRDTHGLFDYESRSTTKSNFKISSSCSIFRANQTCYAVADDTKDIHEGPEPLLSIRKNLGTFLAHQFGESNEKLWFVVKYMKSNGSKGHIMHEGDWLKLGRVRFRVKKISINKGSNVDIPGFLGAIPSDMENIEQEDSNQGNNQCRICLYDNSTKADPLISPCKCSGTMKYVHINCLKEWLKNKVATRQSERAISYYWKDLACELCKTKLPSCMNFEGQKIELVSMAYPTKSYMIIEDYRPESRQSHGLHIISIEEGQLALIGRGHECDVKLSDISVSRHHARIKLQNNQFIIEDQNSKFGTLLQAKKTIPLSSHHDVTIQANRTVLHMSLKEPWNCGMFCMCLNKQVMPVEEISYLTQEGGNFEEEEPEEIEEDEESQAVGMSSSINRGSDSGAVQRLVFTINAERAEEEKKEESKEEERKEDFEEQVKMSEPKEQNSIEMVQI